MEEKRCEHCGALAERVILESRVAELAETVARLQPVMTPGALTRLVQRVEELERQLQQQRGKHD